jgi:hypothetical protein
LGYIKGGEINEFLLLLAEHSQSSRFNHSTLLASTNLHVIVYRAVLIFEKNGRKSRIFSMRFGLFLCRRKAAVQSAVREKNLSQETALNIVMSQLSDAETQEFADALLSTKFQPTVTMQLAQTPPSPGVN